jgi:molybdate transport system regulatory protein
LPKKPSHLQVAQALGHPITDKRLLILRSLAKAGSISQAARDAGVSYKAAWQAIDTLSNLSGVALVEKAVGGTGGGGATLTAAGQQLLDAAQRLGEVREVLLADIRTSNQTESIPQASMAMALRTSMRNQFLAQVVKLKITGGLAWVEIELTEDIHWVAKITKESAQLLDLKPGVKVMALCKATAVHMSRQPPQPAPANLVVGTVTRQSRGNPAEISLQLGQHLNLIGFANHASTKKGDTLYAFFEDSSLVLALV